MNKKKQIDLDLNSISYLLSKENSSLETEVIWSAMMFLKRHPNATIHEAIQVGLMDWDI